MLSTDIQTIAKVVDGQSTSSEIKMFTGVCTDTRSEVNGKLFIALEGQILMLIAFTKQAEDLGASAIIAHKKIDSSIPVIQVKNTEKAYQDIASWHRQSHSPIVVLLLLEAMAKHQQKICSTLSCH